MLYSANVFGASNLISCNIYGCIYVEVLLTLVSKINDETMENHVKVS